MEIYSEKLSTKWTFIEWLLTLLVNTISLILATKIFKGCYIESFIYAIVVSILIVILNKLLKPFLKIVALPITIISLGILYPIVDTIILKLAYLIMRPHFIVNGWITPFFISIFIAIISLILDACITKVILRGEK